MAVSNLLAPHRFAVAIPFEIIDAGSAGVWSTSGTPTGWAWTVASGTTLLIGCNILGANENVDGNDFSAVTIDGQAMTEIGRHSGTGPAPNLGAPGQQWWWLASPPVGASLAVAPTLAGWTGGANPAANATQMFFFNIRGANAAPIGTSDFPAVASTGATSKSDSITSIADGSILLSCGSVQGGTGSTASFSAADGLTMLGSQVATGSSTSTDITSAVGWKQLAAAGAQAYGWSWVLSDGNGISAVEIKAP